MSTHKDLPTGSGKWAADIDAQLRKLQEIEAVARRLCNDFGIDYANPQRGINTGPTPSAQNPVQLKLPSLRDLDIRDAQDGDLLTFDGTRGVWVARRHDTVQLPKEFPQGDPDSYYTPVPVPSVEGIWSDTLVQTNYITNPSFENGAAGWVIRNDYAGANVGEDGSTDVYSNKASTITTVPGGRYGQRAMSVTLHNTPGVLELNYISFDNLPLLPEYTNFGISVGPGSADLYVGVYGEVYLMDAGDNVLAGANSPAQAQLSPTNDPWQTVYLGGLDPSYFPGADHFKVLIRFGGNLESTLEGKQVLLDGFIRSSSWDYFDGDTTGGEFISAWTGTPHDSTSTQSTAKQINAPAVITLGEPFTVLGRGFTPGTTVETSEGDWGDASSLAVVEADGTYTTTLTIPANTDPNVGPVAGPGSIGARVQGPYEYHPFLNVTFI